MEISEIIMETFTLGTVNGLNMTVLFFTLTAQTLPREQSGAVFLTGEFPKRPWKESTAHEQSPRVN